MLVNELQDLIDDSPFHQVIKVTVTEINLDLETVTITLPFERSYSRSPAGIEVHGGVTSTLADLAGNCLAYAVYGVDCFTTDLRVDFLSVARESNLVAKAHMRRKGKKSCVVDIDVFDGKGTLVVIGRANFRVR